jgi:glycosyltransferase involved in cell wall biosynthesis
MVLSFVVPLYNESKRVENLKITFLDFLQNNEFDYDVEIVLVNDGSKDNTLNRLYEIQESFTNLARVVILTNEKNQGKGNALKDGVKIASGEWILTLDADMATNPIEIENWIKSKYVNLDNFGEDKYILHQESIFYLNQAKNLIEESWEEFLIQAHKLLTIIL